MVSRLAINCCDQPWVEMRLEAKRALVFLCHFYDSDVRIDPGYTDPHWVSILLVVTLSLIRTRTNTENCHVLTFIKSEEGFDLSGMVDASFSNVPITKSSYYDYVLRLGANPIT